MSINVKAFAVGAAVLSLSLTAPTSALARTVIVTDIVNTTMAASPFTTSARNGTIGPEVLWETAHMGFCSSDGHCTYDWRFTLAGLAPGDTIKVRLAASATAGLPAVAQNLSFDVFSDIPGSVGPMPISSPTHIGSADTSSPTSPTLDVLIGDGQYYLQVAPLQVAVSGEELSGTLQLLAPEPMAWTLMLMGFGAVGLAMRSRRRLPASMGWNVGPRGL